ncbi:hypothetical protein Tco_0126844, partial [Tanacetum coccineum]
YSYEFLLANKKCRVDAEVFRKILDICPRVEGEEFTELQNDDDTLTFLIDLGYKGPLHKHTNIENINYPELIWEDIAYQIDHKRERKSRRENKPYPKFTKVIINHFLKQPKSLSNLNYQHYHTIKDDGIVSRLKFVRIGEDYQEYGLVIPDVMLNDPIKQSESYQMFIKYFTDQIPPKKSRGKGSQGKKTGDVSLETIDVSEESEPEPLDKFISLTKAEEEEAARQVHVTHARIVTESTKKKTGSQSSRSVVIKDTPSAPKLKPAASKPKLKGVQSLTPAEKEVADIMQALKESKKTSKRQPGTKDSSEGTGTIPGVPDESTVVSATSSERTGTKPGVLDEEKDISEEKLFLSGDLNKKVNTLKKTNLIKRRMIKIVALIMKAMIISYKIHVHKDVVAKMAKPETVEHENKEKDVITDVAKPDVEKSVEEVGDAEKVVGSNFQVKESTEFHLPSSSLSVSSGFGTQLFNSSFDISLTGALKDTAEVDVSSLMDIHIQQDTPQIQSPSVLKVLVSVILETTNLLPIHVVLTETPVSAAVSSPHVTPTISTVKQTTPIPTPPITTDAPTITTVLPESDALSVVQLRVVKLEKDVSELKKIDLFAEALATLNSQVPNVVDEYLGSKLINLEQGFKKSALEILKIKREQAEKQKTSKFTIKSIDKAAPKEYDQKSALYQTMHENKSFNKNHANHKLYHALMEALKKDENAMDKGVADTVKDHKRKHDDDEDDDDEDPPAGPNQGKKTKRKRTKESKSSKKPSTTKETPKGKASSKGSKTSKSASIKEPVEEPIAEVVMDDTGKDVQPPRPPTPDPEWNKHQVVLGHLGHLTIVADYFFNNDLEYLKSSDPERTYTTSITKAKVVCYEIEGIEDMVPTLSQLNKFFKHNVYSTKKILGVKSVSVKKLHGYSHLEEIVVKRADHQLYKFKEGDFVDLHLNDIEDMLLLSIQHKLFHLTDNDIVDFIVTLCMFTRSLVIKKLVEDLQLGVESYQKKLNITPPQ